MRRQLNELATKIHAVQLATLGKEVPAGAWIYELKWDGYRILAYKHGKDVCSPHRRPRKSRRDRGKSETPAGGVIRITRHPQEATKANTGRTRSGAPGIGAGTTPISLAPIRR